MSDQTQTALLDTINYLTDDILGLDKGSKLAKVEASSPDGEKFRIVVKATPGPWVLDTGEIFSFLIDPKKLAGDHKLLSVDLKKEIQKGLDPYVNKLVDNLLQQVSGAEHAIASVARDSIKSFVATKILDQTYDVLASSVLNLQLPHLSDFTSIASSAMKELGVDLLTNALPGVVSLYGKLGISKIMARISGDADPKWLKTIETVENKVLKPVLDNVVDRYFTGNNTNIFDGIKFESILKSLVITELVDFEKWEKNIFDDLLGLDGDNWLETNLANFGSKQLEVLVNKGLDKAIDFFAGKLDLEELGDLFDNIDLGGLNPAEFLGQMFLTYAGSEIAGLIVDIDSIGEAITSKLGSVIVSGAFGDALGVLTGEAVTQLFGQATANVIGATIFQGFGVVLGAGLGAVVGSVAFELLDDLFDGAISGLFNKVAEWIRNDSPQAFVHNNFNAETNHFDYNSQYSKDSDAGLRNAVSAMSTAFRDAVNNVLDFVGESASVSDGRDFVSTVWGKKHFSKSFAAFIAGNESNKVALNGNAEYVTRELIGDVLRHINFDKGNPIISLAYKQWLAHSETSSNSDLTSPDAFLDLQNEIGNARFANSYRQDPEPYDDLMASNAPVSITIMQQLLMADAEGFLGPATLRGSILNLKEIGSAYAGDTIYLDGIADTAYGRGGNDVIYAGIAAAQKIDGGTGVDKAVFTKALVSYTAEVVNRSTKQVVLTDNQSKIKIDVQNVETFEFAGKSQTFEDAFPNRAPKLTAVSALTTAEDTPVHFSVQATDADKDAISYSAQNVTGGTVTADTTIGSFTFTPTPDYNGKAGFNILADDGAGGTASTPVSVTITAVNDVPTQPVLNSRIVSENAVAGTVVGLLQATDKDGDALSYRLIQDAGGRFTINQKSELVVAKDYTFDYETEKSVSVTVESSDGKASAQSAITLSIKDELEPSVVTSWQTANTMVTSTGVLHANKIETFDVSVVAKEGNKLGGTADVPLVSVANGLKLPVVVGVPVGMGFSAEVGVNTPQAGVLDSKVFKGFADTLDATAATALASDLAKVSAVGHNVVTTKLTLSAASTPGGSSSPAFTFSAHDSTAETAVFLIDATKLPRSSLTLDHMQLTVLRGDTTVLGSKGDSIVYADSGKQVLVLGAGNDKIDAGASNDVLGGGAGNDLLIGGGGNDAMNGGFGFDTASLPGKFADYELRPGLASLQIVNKASGEVDTVRDVERISFSDKSVTLTQGRIETVATYLLKTWLHRDLTPEESAAVQNWKGVGDDDVVRIFKTLPGTSALQAKSTSALLAGLATATDIIELAGSRHTSGFDSANNQAPVTFGLNTIVDGGKGVDVLQIAGHRSEFTLVADATQLELTRLQDGAMARVKNVEVLAFDNNETLILAHSSQEATLARLVEVAWDRSPTASEWSLGLKVMASGASLDGIADWLLQQGGLEGLSNAAYVQMLCMNAYGRDATTVESGLYQMLLKNGLMDRGALALDIARTDEAIQLIGSVMQFDQWV